jgi:hypothetical protein
MHVNNQVRASDELVRLVKRPVQRNTARHGQEANVFAGLVNANMFAEIGRRDHA